MTQSQETRILIVDSEPQTSKVLSGWLEAEGYECVPLSLHVSVCLCMCLSV